MRKLLNFLITKNRPKNRPKNGLFLGPLDCTPGIISTPTIRTKRCRARCKMCIFGCQKGGLLGVGPYGLNYFTFKKVVTGGIYLERAKKGLHRALFPPFSPHRTYVCAIAPPQRVL